MKKTDIALQKAPPGKLIQILVASCTRNEQLYERGSKFAEIHFATPKTKKPIFATIFPARTCLLRVSVWNHCNFGKVDTRTDSLQRKVI